MSGDDAGEALRLKVQLMSTLLHERDPALVDELWSPGFRLVGSEPGEIAESRERLVALFDMLFARPVRYAFDYPTLDVDMKGEVAWLFTEGHLVATGAEAVTRYPYRLTAVFVRDGTDWSWRLYSGSEPAKSFE